MGKGIVIGFDRGSSVTKLAAVDAGGTVLGTCKAENHDLRPAETLIAEFAATLGLAPAQVEVVVLTGVGAPRIEGALAGVPVLTVSEFAATARGGLDLSGRDRAVVASMGTGTAFVKAGPDGVTHLGGSGVGGGTLMGLCRRLYGLETFEQVVAAAREGDLDRVDLRIKDIANAAYLSAAGSHLVQFRQSAPWGDGRRHDPRLYQHGAGDGRGDGGPGLPRLRHPLRGAEPDR